MKVDIDIRNTDKYFSYSPMCPKTTGVSSWRSMSKNLRKGHNILKSGDPG